MGAVLILTPIVIGSWPAIAAAAAAAAAAMGFVAKEAAAGLAQKEKPAETVQSVEVDLADSEVVAQQMQAGHEIVLSQGSVEIRVKRDAKGRCVICATGKGHTKAQLKQMAEQFSQKVTQCFMYDKVVRELKAKNFNVVNEEVMEDQTIRLHVRRFVE
jgi:hypothetical protein